MFTPRARHSTLARAFTLVELLVVMGVIVILMSLLVPTIGAIRRQMNQAKTETIIHGISMALNAYKTTFYTYPPDKATGTHADLDLSSECVAYYLSGASIAYNPASPPSGFAWRHELFQDSGDSGRKAMDVFYQFKDDMLVDYDKDKIPEIKGPYQKHMIYNSGSSTDGSFNQYGAPRHNIKKFDIFFVGPDQKYGTDDDVRNWKDKLEDYDYSVFTDG